MSPEEIARARRQQEGFIKPRLPRPDDLVARRGPSHAYNCHGLTFTLRRAWLDDDHSLAQVLEDDGYRQLAGPALARPGDIDVYYDSSDVIEHTGVVVWTEGLRSRQ